MTLRSTVSFDAQFLPMDRIILDGEEYRFLGNSQSGYLFARHSASGFDGVREIATQDLMGLVCQPGRILVEPEHFKKARRK